VNREEKRIMGLTTSAHGLVHLYEGVLPPLIPLLLSEFTTDYFHLGIVATVFSYAFGLGSLPSGFLSDRVGPRLLITMYLFGAGLLSILMWPVATLWSYGLIMALVGLFCSTYHPASNTLISLAIREKGKAFGIHGIAGSLGVAVVPVLSAWIGSAMGWKAPHILFGLMGLGAGLYSLTIPRRSGPAPSAAAALPYETSKDRISYLNLVVFFLSATSLGLTYKGVMTFLPAYMAENVHFAFLRLDVVALGGTITTFALLSGAVGQYVAGSLVDRYSPEKLYLGAVLIGMVFVFFMSEATNVILIAAAIVYAFFFFATQPIQNYILSRYLPRHRHGVGYGIHFFLTFGVGSTAAAVSGYLADHFGLKSVFYAMGFCFAASACLVWILVIRARNSSPGKKF
jgi:MFS family permease